MKMNLIWEYGLLTQAFSMLILISGQYYQDGKLAKHGQQFRPKRVG